MKSAAQLWTGLLVFQCLVAASLASDPKFDPTTRMRLVLVPADAAVGSVIYRLRASDDEFDYPLKFELVGEWRSTASVERPSNGEPLSDYCRGRGLVDRPSRLAQVHQVQFYLPSECSVNQTPRSGALLRLQSVRQGHERRNGRPELLHHGHQLHYAARRYFPAQNWDHHGARGTYPNRIQHFPPLNELFRLKDAKRGMPLDYVIARKSPLVSKDVILELHGSPLFAIRQKIVSQQTTEGTIILLGPLDFEMQSMYHLTVLANVSQLDGGMRTSDVSAVRTHCHCRDTYGSQRSAARLQFISV